MKKRYKCTIAYEGSEYVGWQSQKRGRSVQATVESALCIACKQRVTLHGAGRTDAGVHALAQVAHFDADQKPTRLLLEKYLPCDVRIVRIEEVEKNFHARYSASAKRYCYCVQIAATHSPYLFRLSHHMRSLNFPLLKKKCLLLQGKHNFKSFANAGSAVTNFVREIYAVTPSFTSYGCSVSFLGEGFLYKMVRNLMGTLLDDQISEEQLQEILQSQDRRRAAPPAPAKGLFLAEVLY